MLEVEPDGISRRKEHRAGQGSALCTLSPLWDYSGSRMPWLKAGSAPSFQQEIAEQPLPSPSPAVWAGDSPSWETGQGSHLSSSKRSADALKWTPHKPECFISQVFQLGGEALIALTLMGN